jgi:hypothetical protein
MALLKGRTAIITGGSTGIGLATAKRFVEEGAYVFINGRSQTELDVAIKEIGENVTGVQGDGSKPGDRDRLYTAVADTGRGLDVVFANAAAIDVARIGEVTREHLQRALPLLNEGGSIILNSSGTNAEGNDSIGVVRVVVDRADLTARHLRLRLKPEKPHAHRVRGDLQPNRVIQEDPPRSPGDEVHRRTRTSRLRYSRSALGHP